MQKVQMRRACFHVEGENNMLDLHMISRLVLVFHGWTCIFFMFHAFMFHFMNHALKTT